MTIRASDREHVRRRAHYRCEFCGVSEVDSGAELTVDHFQPSTKGGSDQLDNLIYSCNRCNQHKLDYWPESPEQVSLWNPRVDPAGRHFIELENGQLEALTETGAFTLRRLTLNRPPLVKHRKRRRQSRVNAQRLNEYRRLTSILDQLLTQESIDVQEQRQLLTELNRLIKELVQG